MLDHQDWLGLSLLWLLSMFPFVHLYSPSYFPGGFVMKEVSAQLSNQSVPTVSTTMFKRFCFYIFSRFFINFSASVIYTYIEMGCQWGWCCIKWKKSIKQFIIFEGFPNGKKYNLNVWCSMTLRVSEDFCLPVGKNGKIMKNTYFLNPNLNLNSNLDQNIWIQGWVRIVGRQVGKKWRRIWCAGFLCHRLE